MPRSTERASRKKATNVTVRVELLKEARDAGVNLSAVLEDALIEELRSTRRRNWHDGNKDAIAAYNEFVAGHGAFSDDVRGF